MKILKTIEHKLESVFNIMAFIRTVVCLIFIFFSCMSCATIEYAYSVASWERHLTHFQENMDMPNCQWCIDYNKQIP